MISSASFGTITLTTGLKAKVSPQNLERVCALNWNEWNGLLRSSPSNPSVGKLHSFIMGRTTHIPKSFVIHHANRDKFDVTDENLRWASKAWNSWNVEVNPNGSKYKGVYWRARTQTYEACFYDIFGFVRHY